MLFQLYTEPGTFNTGIPSDELFSTRNHICIDGFDTQHTKRRILDQILTRMEPEHLRCIYTSKTKDKTTFSVCLAEGITTNFINEEGYTIAAKAYGMLPGRSDVEWYRYIRESATWSPPTPEKRMLAGERHTH
jgi:hypothetical protein